MIERFIRGFRHFAVHRHWPEWKSHLSGWLWTCRKCGHGQLRGWRWFR